MSVRTAASDHLGFRLSNLGLQLGRRYERTGNLEDLKEAIERVRESIETTPSDHPDRGWRLSNLGLQLGRRYERTGNVKDFDEAIQRTRESIETTPSDHPDQRLSNLSSIHQQALVGCEKLLGPDHTSTLDLVHNLGNLYSDQGKLKEAEKMYQQALVGRAKALGPYHTSTLDLVHKLGNLYQNQSKLKEAEEMY
ncbi:hypothetical protein PISL3812_02870 [Talaromyces islandicus]|uniref:Kinesin light chain n=1 Tax=Talaromyces islandicus TaxID=28573 RepID=A0A0U1LR26_TALIS|nr:hypothetical protein PISL3812_02870 [Talaromyces islandicus]